MSELFIVTGGAGFIGSGVARALNARGHENLIIVDHIDGNPGKHANLNRIKCAEYLDRAEFRERLRGGKLPNAAGVFHLGACSSTTELNADYLRDNNFLYTRELCEWSLATGARFVYASSAATYGDGSLGYCDDDALTPKLQPLNLYGWSKQWFDLWALETGTIRQIAGLKYFNVYGPGEDHKRDMRSMVNKAYAQIARDRRMTLFKSHHPDYKDGEQKRDFLYLDDAVARTLFFYDHPEVSGLFNCGTGVARTWLDVAHALFAAMGIPPQIDFVDMPEAIRDKYQYFTQADMTKLHAAGCTAPCLSVEEGVGKYVREYLSTSSK